MQEQINGYIAAQPEPKGSDMQNLHRIIMEIMAKCKVNASLLKNHYQR